MPLPMDRYFTKVIENTHNFRSIKLLSKFVFLYKFRNFKENFAVPSLTFTSEIYLGTKEFKAIAMKVVFLIVLLIGVALAQRDFPQRPQRPQVPQRPQRPVWPVPEDDYDDEDHLYDPHPWVEHPDYLDCPHFDHPRRTVFFPYHLNCANYYRCVTGRAVL